MVIESLSTEYDVGRHRRGRDQVGPGRGRWRRGDGGGGGYPDRAATLEHSPRGAKGRPGRGAPRAAEWEPADRSAHKSASRGEKSVPVVHGDTRTPVGRDKRATDKRATDKRATDKRATDKRGAVDSFPPRDGKRPPKFKEAAQSAPGRRGRGQDIGEVARIYLGVGRLAGIRADLVGAIANEAGISSQEIGAIEIADRFSLVESS